MKNTMKMRLFLISALIFFTQNVSAQFEFNYPKTNPTGEFEKLFVRMDENGSNANTIKSIITDNWKSCPIEYYTSQPKTDDLQSYNLFLTVKHDSAEVQVVKSLDNPNAPTVYKHYYFINFCTIEKLYDPKKSIDDNFYTVARAELFDNSLLKEKSAGNSVISDLSITSLNKYFFNGTDGNFKNIIQYVNNRLKNGKAKNIFDEVIPTSAMPKLLYDTLFIPDYGLEGLSTDSKEYKSAYAALLKMQKAYSLKSKVISRDELSTKILNAKSDFFYLNYIQSSESEKTVSVVNGFTGEVIYSVSTMKSAELKEKDLVEIAKVIKE